MPLLDLSGRGAEVREQIAAAVHRGGHGQQVKVVAVTKTHPVETVLAAAAAGFHDIGENKVQEAMAKVESVADRSIRWHLIGHLQRNKVKNLRAFHLFHALDSSRLADAINAEFSRGDQGGTESVSVLVQVNVSGEASKGGFSLGELRGEAERLMGTRGITVKGAMTMAPFDATEAELRKVFAGAREAREILRRAGHRADELSMGMSHDFIVAVEEGATMVRLGTALFGDRT